MKNQSNRTSDSHISSTCFCGNKWTCTGSTPAPVELEEDLKRQIHVFVCATLGLDDEDHEDDEEARPAEEAMYAWLQKLLAQSNQRLLDELEGQIDNAYQDSASPEDLLHKCYSAIQALRVKG
jgi:hypothetical protein